MMDWLDMSIPDLFKLALRLIAAAGGFVVGYLVAGPAAGGLFRLAFHKPMPRGLGAIAKLGGGLLLAAIVFMFLPLGSGGGGGGGSGGGIGSGKGPYKGGQGNGQTATSSGKGFAELGTGKEKTAAPSETLVIEMLGPTTAQGDKYYLLDRKPPAVNFEELEAYWKAHRDQWSRVDVVLTRTSTSENDPAVDRLRKLVLTSDDNKKRTLSISDGSAK